MTVLRQFLVVFGKRRRMSIERKRFGIHNTSCAHRQWRLAKRLESHGAGVVVVGDTDRVSSLLLFGISPTFPQNSYFLALKGKISSYFLEILQLFFDFVSKICNFPVNFEDFRKFVFNFEKISLFLTDEIFEPCSVIKIVNKGTSKTAVKNPIGNS